MSYTGINLENVKINNRSAILKLLNDEGETTRKDLAIRLGLTPATVTLITSELLNEGIILEKGEVTEEKRAGRRKVLIDLNENYRYVLTISIEEAETVLSLCNIKGRIHARKSLPTDKSCPAEVFLERVTNESVYLMWESGLSREQILGVGVTVPGLIQREEGISQRAYRIWDYPVEVTRILSQKLDFPILLENNVTAFALGELLYGSAKTEENLLIVKWGPGLGSSIIIGNRIYDSHNSKNAEIGHMIVSRSKERHCRCGKYGCLETYVSTHAITDLVKEAYNEGRLPELKKLFPDDSLIEASNIEQWMDMEIPEMQEVLSVVFQLLARKLDNLITILAPDKVIFYGRLYEIPGVSEAIKKEIYLLDPQLPENYLLDSDLKKCRDYIGPLAVVVDELFLKTGATPEKA